MDKFNGKHGATWQSRNQVSMKVAKGKWKKTKMPLIENDGSRSPGMSSSTLVTAGTKYLENREFREKWGD